MSIMSPHPPSHRVSDVAALLGVSDDTVRRWIDQRFSFIHQWKVPAW